jgi:dihydroflavonol-4-reductase
MTTLVTGASGFVGSAVARALLQAGHNVRVLLRPQSDRRNIEGLPVDIAIGDLADRGSLAHAVAGCDALFHVAADYRMWVPDPDRIYGINVKGTRELMMAAADAGVSRIVYTSSVATLGLNDDGSPADESTAASIDDMIGHYKRSKFLAEQAVRELVAQTGLPAVIVNPSAPLGPRDIRPTPTGRLIVDAVRGRMPVYVETGLNLVHVDDVAIGHLLAFERGRIGERYILGAENMSLRDILAAVAEISGTHAPRLRVPHTVVLPLAYACETWARLSGSEPWITVDGVRLARKHMYFSTNKARRELGFDPRPAKQALIDAITWFRQHHYC